MFDLQRAFPRPCPSSEDFQNQAGAVDDFRTPCFLEVALLHGRDRTIHHHHGSRKAFDHSGDLVDLAFADIGGGPDFIERDQPGFDDCQVNCAGKANRLFKARLRRARVDTCACATLARWTLDPRLDDNRTACPRPGWAQEIGTLVTTTYFQSDLVSGWRLLGAFEELDRVPRHDGRNGVLVHELGMSI